MPTLYPLYPPAHTPFSLELPVTTHTLTWACRLLKFYPSSLLETFIPTIRDKNLLVEQVYNKVHMING